MAKDKYTAVWVSHSSIRDYLQCPRAYYLNNVYKDPKTNRKINIVAPPLALGQSIHAVLESLSVLPVEDRFAVSLQNLFEKTWQNVTGELGGFVSTEQENEYKRRGKDMLARVEQNPGPLAKKAVKIKKDLPYYWLSEEHNIILCGKIDWIEYDEDTDSVHIIDFKTGRGEEDEESLQLPIYYLLATNSQERPVTKMSYWYLDKDDSPVEVAMPDGEQAELKVLEVAKRIKTARKLEQFTCRNGEEGCFACSDLEKVIKGEAKYVGVGEYNQDLYIVEGRNSRGSAADDDSKESVIL